MTEAKAPENVNAAFTPQDKPVTSGVPCPRCGSEKLHRSHRDNFYERVILETIRIRPYRCESCNLRFYSRKRPLGT